MTARDWAGIYFHLKGESQAFAFRAWTRVPRVGERIVFPKPDRPFRVVQVWWREEVSTDTPYAEVDIEALETRAKGKVSPAPKADLLSSDFDRTTYQREYMRDRRKAKAAGLTVAVWRERHALASEATKPDRKTYLKLKARERRARETAAAKAAGLTVKAWREREKK